MQYPFLHRSRCNCTIGGRKAKTKNNAGRFSPPPSALERPGRRAKMAHIITDAEAQTLTRIAKSLIGPLVSQGLIQKRNMDDAVQDLLLLAIRAAETFSDEGAADFVTYAHHVMQFGCYRVVRKNNSASTKMISNAVSIEEISELEDTDDAPDYGKIGMQVRMPEGVTTGEKKRQDQILLIREVIASLSPESQKICRLLSAECSVSEIARRTALTRKIVRLRIESIKTALLEAGVVIRGKNN